MQQENINKLEKILGAGNCQVDPDIRRQHSCSKTALPDAVVYPENSQQVAEVLQLAGKEGIPVVPWGAGTMAWRGLLPLAGGLVINLTRMNKIIEYDYENMTAYVEAGIPLGELQKTLRTHNLYWPVEPVEPDTCTVGGCIAAGASGPSKLGYGDVKFHILGLEVVLPTGEIIHTGGKTVKNVQDYDNTRFLAGSWGALGIITKAMLKLRPVPEKETTVFLPFKQLAEAIAAARIIRNDTLPVALELLDGAAIAVLARAGWKPDGKGPGVLVAYNGFREQVDTQVDYVKKQFPAAAILEGETAVAAWQARRQLFPVFAGESGAILASVAVPFTALEEFLTRARDELDRSRKGAALAAHFGNGHVHILLDAAPGAYAGVQETVNRLASLAGDLGGLLVVNNIDDLTLTRHWVEARGKALMELLSRIKAAFDPQRIMAPNSKVLAYVIDNSRAVS
ncbi:FAD-linked oxidase, C-terminal [Moorella glycerini]|uniref:FAD-linked oxidoreductase n=1 Tax=Neomoorella stamsii TaxID=1266720 RepID=A0A9X7P620_9FIRM|nr:MULTISPECIES: FAD-binding oxidoreductase [Moorella]PRR72638.1 putative FAD-linked oxidoreductase [Moorella stamsii]CEP67795.1 FAD-linked oxidase, C-terminal [Moorella glycerini]